jgi:acetyl-CoA synthetase
MEQLEAYHLHEQEWESYADVYESFEWEIPDTFNRANYLCDRWAQDSDRVAVYVHTPDGERGAVTYRELRDKSNQIANFLIDQGLEKGDRVAVTGAEKPIALAGHVGAWKTGAVSIPFSPQFGTEALSYRLEDAEANAYIAADPGLQTLRDTGQSFDHLEAVVSTGDLDAGAKREIDVSEILAEYATDFETVKTGPEDEALIYYTSGTTGPPKGVVHAHRGILGRLPMLQLPYINLEMHDDETFYIPADWSWLGSLGDGVFLPMFYGLSIVALQGQIQPKLMWELVDRYDVTTLFAPNTVLRMMRNAVDDPEQYDTSSLRVIPSGGEALDQSVVDWVDEFFDVPIHQGFGQTEANGIVGNCRNIGLYNTEALGKPMPGHEVEIVDPETAEATVETGEVGEIAFKYEDDPACFKRYLNKPEKTAKKVQNGWLLTEDLGWKDEDGYIYYKSRKDDVIISSGYRIGPEEIEDVLGGHEAVADSGVIGVPDDVRGEVPKAFVVLREGYEASNSLRSDLQQYVKDKLAKYEYPRRIEFIAELPKTVTNKVRRKDLRELADTDG